MRLAGMQDIMPFRQVPALQSAGQPTLVRLPIEGKQQASTERWNLFLSPPRVISCKSGMFNYTAVKPHISQELRIANETAICHNPSIYYFIRDKKKKLDRSLIYQHLSMLRTGQRSRCSDWLRAGRSGDRIPVGARFSASVQTGSRAHPASCAMGTGSFPGAKSGRGVMLTHHPFQCRGHERVELYLYSPYVPYGLYRASVPVQGCTLSFT